MLKKKYSIRGNKNSKKRRLLLLMCIITTLMLFTGCTARTDKVNRCIAVAQKEGTLPCEVDYKNCRTDCYVRISKEDYEAFMNDENKKIVIISDDYDETVNIADIYKIYIYKNNDNVK